MAPKTRTPAVERLQFNDKLVKGHPTDVLLKKLKALRNELMAMDQERVDTKSLAGVRKELVNTSLLLHKDKGVKAYVACCLADLLRLYAPDAPYTAHELRDIFQFFIRQLSSGLKGPDSPYYPEYFYLLESLASIKSVVLVCDLPQADELMTEIFRECFDLVRQNLAKNVEMFIADILVALIDEASTIPQDMMDVILAQFMQKPSKLPQPPYRLAVEVCTRTSERLQRNVCQYFMDVILQSDDEEELDRIETAHELIKALNRDCSSLLLNVVPQLEEELRVDRLQMRTLSTQALGEMFGEPKNGVELSRKYPSAWHAWLQRRNDKASPVRLAFVEATKDLIANHSEFRADMEDALRTKLLDPDDKIRSAACRVYSQLDYETALHHVSSAQLKEVASRCMDKKSSVRMEAFECLGKLFKLAVSEIESGDALAVEQFSWIPNHIFQAAGLSATLKAEAEDMIYKHILPLPQKGDDEAGWTDHLLAVATQLDNKGMQSLLAMSNIKTARPSAYDKLLDCCVANNGGVIDENEEIVKTNLTRTIAYISNAFPDPPKCSEDLHSFAKANDSRLYKTLRVCMDAQTDLKALTKAQNEFLRRAEQTLPSAYDTLALFLRRTSFWIFNRSSIPPLVKRMQRDDTADSNREVSTTAQTILQYISKHCPALYNGHVVELSKALADTKHPRLVETTLQALAAAVRADPTLSPSDKRTIDRLAKLTCGDNPRLAKFSARILACSKNRTELCETLMDKLATSLPNAQGDDLVSHLAVMAQFAIYVPNVFEARSDSVVGQLVRIILSESPPEDISREADWIPEDSLDSLTRAKLLSVKICVNRCLAYSDPASALDISTPVFKMLWKFIEHGGSAKANSDESASAKSHMRLVAGVSLLKLSSVEMYCKIITGSFPNLAITIQDTCFDVRSLFLSKLIKYMVARKLDARFNIVLFLTAHDPEKENRDRARSYITLFSQRGPPEVRASNFEMIFIRLLHLLAHHPDFSADADGLRDMAKYIEFFVDIIATSDNVSLLYHLALKAKTVRDAENEAYSLNLYIMSELAQQIIRARAKSQSWTIAGFPGKIRLPVDIFKPHASPESANKVMKTVYLPESASIVLSGVGKTWKSPTNKTQPQKPPRKRKSESTNGHAAASRAKRRRKTNSDGETSDALSDDDGIIGRRGDRRSSEGGESSRTPLRRSARAKGTAKQVRLEDDDDDDDESDS